MILHLKFIDLLCTAVCGNEQRNAFGFAASINDWLGVTKVSNQIYLV